jgi:hypothetical protein
MRGLRNGINQFRHLKGNTTIVASIFALGVGVFGVLGLVQQDQAKAMVRNCDNNSIMNCGAENGAEFKQKCEANAPGDLKTIYNHYWIPCNVQVVQGQAFKDGTVRVNGRVVATNAKSIGRQPISGSRPISIGGKTYYETPNSAAFISDGLPTMVALDAQGNFKYAIINACGNPIYATPVPPTPPPTPEQPKFSCTSLALQNISNTKKRFTITGSATGGAQIVGYRIDFGDGKAEDLTGNTVDHEYTPGNYTIKATVKVKVGNETKLATGANCEKKIVVKAPGEVACTSLDLVKRDGNKYDFTITKTETNATYKGATMDYGDGQSEQITGTTASHEYAKAGNYSITATLKFDIDGSVKEAKCTAKITTSPCPTNPSLPKDSPDCQPCPYNPELPKDSPECVPPTTPELPKTGAGDMIVGGFGLGSIIVAGSYYMASRRDLLSAFLSR